MNIPDFTVYTLDNPGSVSGGFDPSMAWRNFPVCQECCERVDFAGERVKKHLSFDAARRSFAGQFSRSQHAAQRLLTGNHSVCVR